MAKKKNTQVPVSQEENTQAQQYLDQYHQIATTLRASTDQKQVETALAEINSLPEGTQIALAKELSKQNHTDAADVLVALNELAELKSVRKEARRSLIRLEGTKVYPRWRPPLASTPEIATLPVPTTTNPPRFWKGFVSDTRELGEVQLLLAWQQGEDYKEVRSLGFLLEFWQEGVKEFFTHVESRRSFENLVEHTLKLMPDIRLKDCSLAEGRRLVQSALAVNTRSGIQPHKDYQLNVALINELMPPVSEEDEILDFGEEEEEEEEEFLDLQGLEPGEVVVSFIESWMDCDYEAAYDHLTPDSPLREGLSQDEWVDRRDTWADKHFPDDLRPHLLYEREPQKSQLWLPFSKAPAKNQKEVMAGWSFELEEEPVDDPLPEWPEATAIYEETGRHWFWASYTLVQENNEWHIENIIDEGLKAQNLSIEELTEKVEGFDKALEDFAQMHQPEDITDLNEDELGHYLTDIINQVIEAAYYTDILLKKLPLDRAIYEEAATRMFLFGQFERCLVYLLPLSQRFPEEHGSVLRRTAQIYQILSVRYFEEDHDERGELFQELAEKALHDSLIVEDHIDAHITLAELFIEEGERLDEAEEELALARKLISNEEEEAHIELHLGEIATAREEYQQAFTHYQRVAELEPDSAQSWFNLGQTHRRLENFEEAATSYRRAIELEPDDDEYYSTLALMYKQNDRPEQAIAVIENGLRAIPDSAELYTERAILDMDSEDYDQAERWLEKAESLDPTSDLVHVTRQTLNAAKAMRASDSQRAPKLLGGLRKKSKKH